MASRRRSQKTIFGIEENLRIAVQIEIDAFRADETQKVYKFPSTLSNTQRAFIHNYVQNKGLKSKSYGKGIDRNLVVFKDISNTYMLYNATFNLQKESKVAAFNFLKAHPLTQLEKCDLNTISKKQERLPFQCSLGSFKHQQNVIPSSTINQNLIKDRQNLPIYQYRDHILNTIRDNQVVVISGDTGSGKTTQVPQYIMEDHSLRKQPCKIICTQPRRLAAISIATRVSHERNVELGLTIGYQIRLESRISPNSNLVYTTSGYLLRCLIGGTTSDFLGSITHLILDEVHERDKYTDFLLIAIKESLTKNPHIKVILMSATIESNIFINYFNNCPIVNIPGRMYPVDQYHLEDVLNLIGYTSKKLEKYKNDLKLSSPVISTNISTVNTTNAANVLLQAIQPKLDYELVEFIDEVLLACWCSDNLSQFDQFFYLVTGENVPIDYKHSQIDMNALMIAAGKGLPNIVEILLQMGADPKTIGAHELTACQWAFKMNKLDCYNILSRFEDTQNAQKNQSPPNQFNEILLKEYQQCINEADIDHNLLFQIIKYIHQNLQPGSILVFLPGYDDIVEQNETILSNMNNTKIDSNIKIYMLHSSMQAADQKAVFVRATQNTRKIILSTNIAETSITIDDVVYVVDCGKVKQKSYDAITGATCLTSTWISQACAKQRMGRAGRTCPGVCYRLYSTLRYNSMQAFTLPEILRVPLTEICLNAKIMATDMSISDFLAKAMQPPPEISVTQSIRLLQKIGALDNEENITELGVHLVDLPVDVQLGKVLLYSILLKCIDPVLTIVSSLSVKDPFVLPGIDGNGSAKFTKKSFAEESCSDHLVFINLFQRWLDQKALGHDRKFCRDNFISSGTMELICGVRSQILGYLRSVGMVKNNGYGNMTDLNKNSSNWAMVKACLTGGLYPNICRIDKMNGQLKSQHENKLIPHQSSVLREKNPKKCQENLLALPSEWLLFGEKSQAGRFCLVRHNTVVTPVTLALFAGSINMPETNLVPFDDSDSDDEENKNDLNTKYIVDNWIEFVLDTNIAYFIYNMRQKLNALFLNLLINPKKMYSTKKDIYLLDTIAKILQIEDISNGLVQAKSIGKRPMPVKLNFLSELNYGIQEKSYEKRSDEIKNQASGSSGNHHNRIISRTRSSKTNIDTYNNIRQALFNKNIRYFMVKVRSKTEILEVFDIKCWRFNKETYVNLVNIKTKWPSTLLLLFFYITELNIFYGVGEFDSNNQIKCITQNSITLMQASKMITSSIGYSPRSLNHLHDGEEVIDENVGKLLLKLMLNSDML